MAITKEILKQAIDDIQDEYVEALYTVIKAFKRPGGKTFSRPPLSQEQWTMFLDKFAGSLAEAPIKRGKQGSYEFRESLQ